MTTTMLKKINNVESGDLRESGRSNDRHSDEHDGLETSTFLRDPADETTSHQTIESNLMSTFNSQSASQQTTPSSPPTESCSLLRCGTTSSRMRLHWKKFGHALKERNLLVDVLAILFGIGSWIGINSIYLQLPLLVADAPEGWSLPSYLVVIIQVGNIGPILYTVVQKCLKIKDAHIIYGLFAIGAVAAIFTAFYFNEISWIGGQEMSLTLFVLVFFLALVGCTSSVLFMPYMGRFREIYLITYLIGEGLSGFLPSIVALIQGVGGNTQCIPSIDNPGEIDRYTPAPRFGTKEFFIFVFSVLVCSGLAFVLLSKWKRCKKEYAAVTIKHGNEYVYEKQDIANTPAPQLSDETLDAEKSYEKEKKLSIGNYRLLMVLMAIVCMFGNGIFPSIQSYSCLPYGNIAYHLTVTLSSIANPIACFLAVFLPHYSIRSICILALTTAVFAAYALATALMSPTPPMVGTDWGVAIIVICWTILVGLISYIKLSITTVFRLQGGKSLVWIGAVSQAGSAVGATVTFVLVLTTKLFVSYEPC